MLGELTAAAALGQAAGSATAGWIFGYLSGGGFWIVAAVLATGVGVALHRQFNHARRAPATVVAERHQAVGHGS